MTRLIAKQMRDSFNFAPLLILINSKETLKASVCKAHKSEKQRILTLRRVVK